MMMMVKKNNYADNYNDDDDNNKIQPRYLEPRDLDSGRRRRAVRAGNESAFSSVASGEIRGEEGGARPRK